MKPTRAQVEQALRSIRNPALRYDDIRWTADAKQPARDPAIQAMKLDQDEGDEQPEDRREVEGQVVRARRVADQDDREQPAQDGQEGIHDHTLVGRDRVRAKATRQAAWSVMFWVEESR